MAKSLPHYTWKKGFRQDAEGNPWEPEIWSKKNLAKNGEHSDFGLPPSLEALTSNAHNSLGINVLRTWPTLYDGTNSPHGIPEWWKPSSEVDVLICGAGPYGLQVALSLVRQGVSCRIIDKSETPLIAGRADGVQPRFLEVLNTWGLAQEVHEEGPIIESTVIYRDGQKVLHGRSHQSDSRYRGLHIITQGQLERIYIRDLMRHRVLIERPTVLKDFVVKQDLSTSHPVQATIENATSGETETIRAKFLVGSDGASSKIRKQLEIPFDGVSTDIYWGIIDCVFDTDFPYPTTFGAVVSTKHGGCVIVPREGGYTRMYTQIDAATAQNLAQTYRKDASLDSESGGRVSVHSITPEECLAQMNRIFAPYTWRFKSPLSWFAVWRISERVARSFSSPDLRVHLGGDAAHVHSVMGAFGLNASIMDASNLAWKMGLCAQGKAEVEKLLPTYDSERRQQARRIIGVSGAYLRYICNSQLPLADLADAEEDSAPTKASLPVLDGTPSGDLKFLGAFFHQHGSFLLGIDAGYRPSVISPSSAKEGDGPVNLLNGVRAPNPRICLDESSTGYLYDKMTGAATFHMIVFGSNLQGPVRESILKFAKALTTDGFLGRHSGSIQINTLLVLKALPFESSTLLADEGFDSLKRNAMVLYDDRAPDEDAHYWYGVNHARGAVVIVRPDLWVGTSAFPEETERIKGYFDSFLVSAPN